MHSGKFLGALIEEGIDRMQTNKLLFSSFNPILICSLNVHFI